MKFLSQFVQFIAIVKNYYSSEICLYNIVEHPNTIYAQ